MNLPTGFYAMPTALFRGPIPSAHPCFVRTKFVSPVEQAGRRWNRSMSEYPRLVMYGGPTTMGADASAQRIMYEYASSLGSQLVKVPEYTQSIPLFWLTSKLAPVPIWKSGSFGDPTLDRMNFWPWSEFRWLWVTETGPISAYTPTGRNFWSGTDMTRRLARL